MSLMDDGSQWTWLIVLLLLFAAMFFAITETAFASVSRVRLKTDAERGDRRAERALFVTEHFDRAITTLLICTNIVHIATASIVTVYVTKRWGVSAVSVSTLVTTLVVFFFGEMLPKSIARKYSEPLSLATAGILSFLMMILRPLDLLFGLWRKLLGKLIKPEPEETQIEDELMTMIDEAQTEGDIEEEEVELIRSAIVFNDQDAADIMTPRVDVTAIEDTATIDEAADVFRDTWFSRVPVYHEDLDHIVGILHEKDFYKMTHEGVTDITQIMKEPVFAPASLPIGNLLKQFRSSQTHLIILLDEFGGTEGIVTMEDVLEELVGEIYDEHDEVNEEVVEQDDGTLIIDGNMQLQELLDKLEEENEYDTDTVGGWAAEMLEKVPEVGDSFTLGRHQFTVTEMDGFRVTRMQVTELPEEEPEEPETKEVKDEEKEEEKKEE